MSLKSNCELQLFSWVSYFCYYKSIITMLYCAIIIGIRKIIRIIISYQNKLPNNFIRIIGNY